MKAHFRSSLLIRVKRLTLGRLPNGSVACGSPFPAVRIISTSQCAYFNSESKPSNVAQWDKDAKDELKRPQPLDLSVEGIAIQSECKVPGAAGISIAEKAITFDLPSTIDLQKKCAKQQLDSMVEQLRESDETFFSKVPIIQEISSRLDDGRVPPVFHALGMPHEWLGGKKLCLSLTPVEPGEVKQESRLDLEFHARNKEEIVGDDLKAVKRIEQEGSVAWVFNKIATDWAVNLVNTDAQMRGSNVESTPVGDLSSLVVDDSEKMLLTRPQSGVLSPLFSIISALQKHGLRRQLQVYQGSVNHGHFCMFCSKRYSMKEYLLYSLRMIRIVTCFIEEVAKCMPGRSSKLLSVVSLPLKKRLPSSTLQKLRLIFHWESGTLFSRHLIVN